MGARRILGSEGNGHYHVVSRVVDRRFVFGKQEQLFFRRQLRALEGFTGVRCLTYCVMSNHFHLLLEVSRDEKQRFEAEGSDAAFMARLCHVYAGGRLEAIREELARLRRDGDVAGVEALKRPYIARMHDLAVFMRELKQRFSRWFNGSRGRKGTLWEGRYRSVLVDGNRGSPDEGAHSVLAMVAAYIDLNPVRAGLVQRPGDHRSSGFGEAEAGGVLARQRLAMIYRSTEGACAGSAEASFSAYRDLLDAAVRSGGTGGGSEGVRSSDLKALLCRIRHLVRGAAVGSRTFVEGVFAERREMFGPNRRSGARRLRGPGWPGLFALRDLGESGKAA